MGKVEANKIHLESVITYKSKIEVDPDIEWSLLDVKKFDFSFAHDSAISLEMSKVRIRLNILNTGLSQDEERLNVSAEFGIEFIFNVENLSALSVKKGENLEIVGVLANTLMSIAFSTARGIVLKETELTKIGGIILPVLDPNTLLHK